MNTNLTERNYSRQSHLIINAKYGLSTREINMILTLLTAIDKKDEDFKNYMFTLSDFKDKTDITMTTNNLKQVIRGLMAKPLEIQTSNKKWEIFNWFSYFKFDNGVITCRFDKALKPYLLEIKERFVISDLRMILPMRSSYSKRMYLILKEYAKIGKRTFIIEELQDLLKVPTSHKERYSKFKSDVLKRAEIDINKFTDLEVSFLEKKRGKKVIAITYIIKKNHNDLKSFISYIRELYVNELLFHTKEKRPLKCSEKGLLYYSDNNQNINKKESQKLWEYLHENRKELYVFKVSEEEINEMKKNISLISLDAFKDYLKENFAHKKIIRLTKSNTKEKFDVSIFPNGKLYDMSGESLDENSEAIWELMYELAQNGRLKL